MKPEKYLPNAFRSCGLVPISIKEAVKQVPHIDDRGDIEGNIDQALLEKLSVNRFGDQSTPKAVRGKWLPSGKSYTSQGDTSSTGESSSDEPDNESDQGSDKEVNMNSEDELELPELPDPMTSAPTEKKMTKRCLESKAKC